MSLTSDKGRPGCAEDAPAGINLDTLHPQELLLLVNGDALAVAGPVALEAAELAAGGHDPVAGDLGSKGVAAQGVADGARARPQARRHEPVRRHVARRDLAEQRPHLFLKGRAVRRGYALQLGGGVGGRGDGARRGNVAARCE